VSTDDLVALGPLIALGATAVVTLLSIAARRNQRLTATLAGLGFVAAALALPFAARVTPRDVTALVRIDDFALLYIGLFLAAGFATVVLAHDDLRRRAEPHREEFHVLVLVSTLGACVLASSTHFASFFLGLETSSVALYALIAYPRSGPRSVEAGVKYLLLAGASSAFLLFGMALVYADLGVLTFDGIPAALLAGRGTPALVWPALALLVAGAAFKLAVAPFHMWVPDVYQGAPAPVTGFLATVSKGAVLAALLRLFVSLGGDARPVALWTFGGLAIASMLAGNLLALYQRSLKRLLACSSIAHLGYVLVAFLAAPAVAAEAVTWYLVAYFVTTLAAFGVVTVLSDGDREADALDDYRGLFWRRPWLAALLTGCLLSLAGIPLTAGFLAKFYALAAGASAALWVLVVALVVNSALSAFYYLRVVVEMLGRAPEAAPARRVPLGAGALLAVLALLLVGLGVYPAALTGLVRASVGLESASPAARGP
jgi:NADH-quinone oxidoreductase subunit N